MNSLGYGDEGLDNSLGLRPHRNPSPSHKDKLLRYMHIRKTGKGETKELIPFLDIMHRILRNTLFPRVGNFDMVHGYLVDMLVMCQKEKGKTCVLDVSHVMWSELRSAAYGRKVPIYAPMIFKLIVDTWQRLFPNERLETGPLVSHDVTKLRQKEHWGVVPEVEIPGAESGESDEPEYVPPSEQPSWAAKLKRKVKKLFCFQSDIQHRLYQAHVKEKMDRRRQILMMRKLEIDAPSGSEKTITPEDRWISEHGTWTESDDDVGTSAPPVAARGQCDEEIVEESEDGSDDDRTEDSTDADAE